VINDLTVCVQSASSWTRIQTFIFDASFIRGTVRVEGTFGSATFIGIADVFWKTSTSSRSVLFPTDGVSSTRGWHTRCWSWLHWGHHFLQTLNKRISFVARYADTVRRVTDDATFGVLSARSRTRVFAFLVDTSQVVCTFAVADTFWSAAGWSSHKLGQTRARRSTSDFSAL
jgi:hypothetical protein